jgi:zinc/manganese transport system substrate-binding protein
MKRTVLKLLALSAVAAMGLLAAHARAAEPIPVVASFSILGDLVKVVGGDRVALTTLVGPDADAHAFEPKPSDAKTLLASKLLVINGMHFEPWTDKLAKSANFKGDIVVASKGVKSRAMPEEEGHDPKEPEKGGHHHDSDPHAWQNPNNVILYVRNIAAGLAKADASGAATYKANADAYVKELQALDASIKAQLAAIPAAKRKVITSHDAFGYFAAQYKVKFLAPEGVSTDAEPSAKEVAQLVRQIKREKIRAIFIENMRNPKMLEQLSKDAGATVGGALYSDALSGADPAGSTYLKMMNHNLAQLVAGMKLN